MRHPLRSAACRGLLALVTLIGQWGLAGASRAETVYDNSTTDTLATYFYSTGPYSEIGDRVTLGGTGRVLDAVSVQFFNLSSVGGSFSASLRFYAWGSPVGAQVGSTHVLDNLSIAGNDVRTVSFAGLNELVPDQLVFTVAVSHQDALDLGLNAFQPPAIGSSDDTNLVVRNSGGFILGNTPGVGNLYFVATATAVPEPNLGCMLLAGLAVTGLVLRRRRSSQQA